MNESILNEKKEVVSRLDAVLKGSKSAIIVTYHNLNVKAINTLRAELKKNGGKMEVAKNTLVKRALDGENLGKLDALLKGPNALITGEDETKILASVVAFTKKNKEMEIKGAVIGGVYCDVNMIGKLATVPDKDSAISVLLSVLQMPVTKFACAFKAYADSLQ